MQSVKVRKLLFENFPYEPTEGQNVLLSRISDFIISNNENSLFPAGEIFGHGAFP